MNSSNLLNALLAIMYSVIGAVILLGIQWTVAYLKARRGILTGKWLQLIYDDSGQVVKKTTSAISGDLPSSGSIQ